MIYGENKLSADVLEAVEAIKECYPHYEAAKEYDEIDLWEFFKESREGRTLRQADIEFDPNFCGVVIDAVNNRLEILSVTANSGEVTDDDSTTEATRVLNEVWDDNELGNYIPTWHRKSLRDGDGYIVVWPKNEDMSAADEVVEDDLEILPTGVNITYVDPRIGRMFYDAENPRKKRYFAQMWELKIPGTKQCKIRLNLYYNDRIEKYISTDEAGYGKQAPKFEPFYDMYDMVESEDGEPIEVPVWPMPNPYNKIPVFHLRTDLDYGKPEHRNAFALQDAISKLIEMQMVTVEFQGYPQRYALQEADNFKSQTLDEDPLSDSTPANDESSLDSGFDLTRLRDGDISNNTGSSLEASPGGMMLLKGFRDVREFSAADPNSFLEPWREYGKAISSTTDTPLYKFQGLGGSVPSGESLKVLEAPLNAKVRNRSRLFGATWRSVFEFALEILGITARVNVTWANPGMLDLLEVWQLVELKVRLGVPREVAFMDAGIPEKQAKEWAANFAPSIAPSVRPPVVGK